MKVREGPVLPKQADHINLHGMRGDRRPRLSGGAIAPRDGGTGVPARLTGSLGRPFVTRIFPRIGKAGVHQGAFEADAFLQ